MRINLDDMSLEVAKHIAKIMSITDALRDEGIYERILAKQLKAELKAKATKTIKIKGRVDPETLPRCVKILATTTASQGEECSGGGETVLQWQERAWDVQSKARTDAHKLLGHYPADKLRVDSYDHETALDELDIDDDE
ncbi:MAG: hypothetical protein PHI12_12460 [Dehalococcoidales bacterium]|nr:hypothetical protein [Dehalococcoidales bacterium]